ncbi:MAG: hypothetical protein WCR04_06250 [Fibrobacteraceae bacterium]
MSVLDELAIWAELEISALDELTVAELEEEEFLVLDELAIM